MSTGEVILLALRLCLSASGIVLLYEGKRKRSKQLMFTGISFILASVVWI